MYYRQMPSKQPLGVRGKLRMDGIDAIMIQSDYKVLFFEGLADSSQKENITKALNCFGPYLLNC